MDPSAIRENKIEFIDTLEIPESKEEVIIPYLSSLYDSLLSRSDDRVKGIPRVILIDVLLRES